MFGVNTDRAIREFQRNVGEDARRHRRAAHDRDARAHAPDRDRPEPGAWSARPRSCGRCAPRSTDRSSRSTPATRRGSRHRPCSVLDRERARDELAAMGAKPAVLATRVRAPADADAREWRTTSAPRCASRSHLGAGLPEASGRRAPTSAAPRPTRPRACCSAQLILEELEADARARGRLQRLTVSMLRETRMPAVQVEPLVHHERGEAALIADPAFAGRVGRAVADGRPPLLRDCEPSGQSGATTDDRGPGHRAQQHGRR